MNISRSIALFLSSLALLHEGNSIMARAAEQIMFVGTQVEQQGIYASTLNLETGEIGPAEAVGDAPRPGFLALHPKLPLLYSITKETAQPDGGVRVFQIAPQGKQFSLLGQQPTGDKGATHLALDPVANHIIVAHYAGGSTAVLPLDTDGHLKPLSTLVDHIGSGPNQRRQEAPHAHGVTFDVSGQFAIVTDLGTDEVIIYQLAAEGKLERKSAWKSAPGAGPRHTAFHPNQQWLYCLNELNGTMTVLGFDTDKGELTELQTVDTLPDDFQEPNTTAEVAVHPSGKFVYASNRGHDSTAAYAIDSETGKLTRVEIEPTLGEHPRFIGIEPSGQFLIAANRDSNNLVSFRIDQTNGKLTPTGHETTVPKPVCVVFPPAN